MGNCLQWERLHVRVGKGLHPEEEAETKCDELTITPIPISLCLCIAGNSCCCLRGYVQGSSTLCYMQERAVMFPGMREALCHSLSRRRGLLWLRFQCRGQHVSPGCAGEWGTLCHLSLQRGLPGLLLLLETQGTREKQVLCECGEGSGIL